MERKRKIKTILLKCTTSGCTFKTWRKYKKHFTDSDLTCPKCQEYGSLDFVE